MRAKGFALKLMKEEHIAFAINTSNEELWHRKLGHFHYVVLMYMQRHNRIRGVPRLENRLTNCAACQYRKQARKLFPQSAWRATHKLQLVHIDVEGTQRTTSLNGSRYYIIFINDYSRFC